METQLRRFSAEQIERANRVDILEYARSQGLHLKKQGDSYKVLDYQGGFFITPSKNLWNWFDNHTGGGVVKLCMEIENKTWVEAIKTLTGEEMEPIRHTREWVPEPEILKEFHLPPRNDTYQHVFAYLGKTRGIDEGIIKDMVAKKLIYENTQRSCVFVGRDKEGVAKHASVRSTNTAGKVFKQDVTGSQKRFSFSISGTSGTLNVFEAPIDALSYMSLQKLYKKQVKDSYLSLGGTSDKALEQYLEDHPDIQKIRICTDNDSCLNPLWDAEEKSNVMMHIEKRNLTKELDESILFRTYSDYSQFVQHMGDDVRYIALFKKDLELSEDGKLYSISIQAEQEYMLYESVDSYHKGIGIKVTGSQLYNQHFFKMPAGEKAAYLINEKYKQNYKITRHRPSYKDFNEDLVALKYPERVKAKEQDVENEVQADNHKEQVQDGREPEKQDAEREEAEQIKQDFQLSKEELLKLGIEQRTITWYMDAEKECVDGMFSIKGNSNLLYVYDSPEELVADVDMEMRLWDRFQEDIEVTYREEYSTDEYRAAYQGVRQMKEYISANQQINHVFIKTSRMDTGKQAAEEIKALCGELEIKCDRMEPKLMTFAEDLAMENAVTEIIEQTPLNDLQSLQDLDMAAGMEM